MKQHTEGSASEARLAEGERGRAYILSEGRAWEGGAPCRVDIPPGTGSTNLLNENGLVLQAEVAWQDKPWKLPASLLLQCLPSAVFNLNGGLGSLESQVDLFKLIRGSRLTVS